MNGCNIPNPENKPEVDHINSNRSDNRLENLCWANRKDQSENKETQKKRSYKIEITMNDSTYIYYGLRNLSKDLKISGETIKRYSDTGEEYKGYRFKILVK